MPGEQEELVFGLRYTGQEQVANLANDLGHVERAIQELGESVGRQSYTDAGAGVLQAISSTLRQQYSALDDARARLAQANLKSEDVARRVALTAQSGGPGADAVKAGGFGSESAQTSAQLAAFRGVQGAAKGLDKAYTDATTAVRQSVSAQEALASVGRVVQRGLAQQATAGAGAARSSEALTVDQNSLRQAIRQRTAANEAEARAAEQAAAQSSRLASVDAELAARRPASYESPDINSQSGRLQASVNAAEINLELATRKLEGERNSTTRTYESVRRAEQTAEAAAQRLSSSQNALAIQQARSATGPGSFGQQFATGFKGVSDRPYAEQFGQAVKFSVLYGTAYRALSGITQGLTQALQEGIEFQQAMTELSLASGQSADQMDLLRKNLGDAASQAGAAPSQGVLVGARSLGLFGLTGGGGTPSAALRAQQDQAAEISARVVSRAAFGSGQQPADLQSNLAAIAQAFQQGPEGQVRAYDLDAFLSRRFGVAPGNTYSSVADSATVGRSAGFSQEEVTAIAADLQSRMGTTPEAVSGFMAQIFSRAGEGALTQVDQKYGVDPNADLATQLKALAEVYRKTPSARDDIAAVGGRGKVQNAFIALLQDYPAVQKAAKDAQTGATGAGDTAFNLRLNNVGGQLAVLGGDLKALESEIGRSGLLDAVGAAVKVLDLFVKGLDGILELYNQLDGATKAVVSSFLLAAGVFKARGLLGGLVGGGGAAEGSLISGGAGGLGAAEGGAAGGLASRALVAAQVAGIIGSVIVAGNTIQAGRKLDSATSQTNTLLNDNSLGQDASAEDYQSRAAALRLDADQAHEAAHGFFAHIIDFGNKLSGDQTAAETATDAASRAIKESKRLNSLAAYQQQVAANTPTSQAVVTDFDSASLTASLQNITDSGGNANDRLKAVAAALGATADSAERARAAFDPKLFAGQAAQGVLSAISGAGNVSQTTLNGGRLGGFRQLAALSIGNAGLGPGSTTKNALPGAVQDALSQTDVANRLQAALQQRGITSASDIGPRVAAQLARTTVGNTPAEALKSLGITDPQQIAKLRGLMVQAVKDKLLSEAKSVRDIVEGKVSLSGSEQTAAVGTITSDTQAALGTLQTSDHSDRLGLLRRQVTTIQAAVKASPGGATSSTQDALNAAQRELAEEQIAQLEDLRKAAQSRQTGSKQIAATGRGFLTREIRAAIRGGDSDALAQLVSASGKEGIAIAKKAIDDALAIARAAEATEQQIAAFAAAESAGLAGINRPGQTGGGQSPQVKRLLKLQHSLAQSTVGSSSDNVYATGSDAGHPTATAAAKADTAAQIAAARQSALAGGSESDISQARAAMVSAQADMAAAKKGTVAYYSALGAYLQARNQLTDAVQSFHQNLFLLSHDATNPVVQARAEVLAAAAKLRADANKPADVKAADRVALQASQASLESTRFQQRLDAAQTAEQLGRTSFSAYINYLDHERDRLRKIKDRSFQQQQELNQVDQLLQTAAQSMQGVWNIGDIDLPKPYQVKRYIEQNYGNSAGVGGGSSVDNSTHTVLVNGADTRMVIKVIREVLGANVTIQTTKPRKR